MSNSEAENTCYSLDANLRVFYSDDIDSVALIIQVTLSNLPFIKVNGPCVLLPGPCCRPVCALSTLLWTRSHKTPIFTNRLGGTSRTRLATNTLVKSWKRRREYLDLNTRIHSLKDLYYITHVAVQLPKCTYSFNLNTS